MTSQQCIAKFLRELDDKIIETIQERNNQQKIPFNRLNVDIYNTRLDTLKECDRIARNIFGLVF
jgi:hypothetical protein